MVENYNAIGQNRAAGLTPELGRTTGQIKTRDGQDFKSLLMKSIDEVNRLQDDANKATVDLATGKTDNVAEVFTAVKKAELAFQTLLQIRNKLMDAYDEIKQMRV